VSILIVHIGALPASERYSLARAWELRGAEERQAHRLEAHIRVCDPPKQGFDELINTFAGLASKIGESFFQRGVDGDRGVGHVSVIVPRRRRKDEP